ncbi:hypothetical protein [Nitrospira sp. M1]
MRSSVVVNVLVGMVGMMVVGCGVFEASPPEETRHEYSKFVEDKMGRLRGTHAQLVVQVEQRELEYECQEILEAALDDLTKKSESVQQRIDALRVATGQDWFMLQYGMNAALEELSESYARAFALNAV